MRKSISALIMIGITLILLPLLSSSANIRPGPSQAYRPADDAAVTLTFDGMEALFFGRSDVVSVGILDAHNHTPSLTVTRITAGSKKVITTLKPEQLRGSLSIDVAGGAAPPQRYQPVGKMSVNDPNDFRHALNMNEIYPGKTLTINESKMFGKIHIRSGVYYAADLTDTAVRFFDAKGKGRTLNFSRRVAGVEGKLFLQPGESLIISGSSIETIALKIEQGVRYEISITNLPAPEMASMDHFLFYYGIINEKLEEFVPIQSFKATYAPHPRLCAEITFTDNSLSVP